MAFISLQFAIFFICVFGLYLLFTHKWQNRLLLIASYVFYGFWNWKFLVLIFSSTVINYFCGKLVYRTDSVKNKKNVLWICVSANLLILCFFKYYGFFVTNLQGLFNIIGVPVDLRLLNIVLPVGLSFYTFQAMTYSLDIYWKRIAPTNNFFDFSLFVAFFPNLLAGPIETAQHFLPQILSARKMSLEKFYEGCYLIFWGIFQKVFVADNLGRVVDTFFASSAPYSGMVAILSVYAIAIKVFCDFSGYSDIARGLGKCMGFDLKLNFCLPYFATNIADYWKRWHMSLYSWLKEYVYMPLIFSAKQKTEFVIYRSMFITMVLVGLWHGGSPRFLIWGMYNGFLMVVYRMLQPILRNIPAPKRSFFKKIRFIIRLVFFFQLICFGLLIWQAKSITQILQMVQGVFTNFWSEQCAWLFVKILFFSLPLLLVQCLQYFKKDLLAVLKLNTFLQALIYFICFYLLLIYGVQGGKEFIYFQF